MDKLEFNYLNSYIRNNTQTHRSSNFTRQMNHLVGKSVTLLYAWTGTVCTMLFNLISNTTPEKTFIHELSATVSVTVGLLTALYTITKLIDWCVKVFRYLRKVYSYFRMKRAKRRVKK